jgi:hypothetical protein
MSAFISYAKKQKKKCDIYVRETQRPTEIEENGRREKSALSCSFSNNER